MSDPPARAVELLACPVCHAGLATRAGGALRCAAGHSYDLARQGYVTLLPPGHRPPSGDSAEMVADRMALLDAGHYAGVTGALADAVLADGDPPARLLDLGGGTGHHLAGVLQRLPDAVGVVLDSSRYAARRAARAHPRAMAVVADSWARLPVRDGAVDAVLVVFAPRNGTEIVRVLRPGGRLVVVTPAADHLAEIVARLGLLRVDPDKAGRLASALGPHLQPTRVTSFRAGLELPHADVVRLVGMGPHARHLARDAVREAVATLPEPVPVTVSVDVSTYRSHRLRRASSGAPSGPPGTV